MHVLLREERALVRRTAERTYVWLRELLFFVDPRGLSGQVSGVLPGEGGTEVTLGNAGSGVQSTTHRRGLS